MSQTLIAAIIFTTTGLLLLLGIPKAKYGKILGALSLIAGILNIVLLLAFRTNWNVSWNANWNTDDDRYVPTEQVSKSEIEEKPTIQKSEVNNATRGLWVLTSSLDEYEDTKKTKRRRLKKEVIRLIKNGADVNIANQDGIFPLYFAAQSGNVEMVKLLLDAGANANATDNDGDTPLLTASSHGYAKIVRLLMKAGADVNKPGEYGATPLWEAASGGHVEAVRLLIEARADVHAHSANKVTPLHVAALNGHTKVVKVLLASGAEVNTAKYDEYEAFDNGATPLMDAAARCHTKTVELLIKAGASVYATDQEGVNAMSYASCKKIIKILKSHGARR